MKKILFVVSALFFSGIVYAGQFQVNVRGQADGPIMRVDTSSRAVVNVEAGAITSVASSSTTAKVEAYIKDNGNTITTADVNYETKTSTYLARTIYVDGTITANFTVDRFSAAALDGTATIKCGAGETIPFSNGAPFDSGVIYAPLASGTVFTIDLLTATTGYVYIGGMK